MSAASTVRDADEALARALLAKDPAAPTLAWRRYQSLIRSVVWRRLGSSEGADDLVQDVFTHLFRSVHTLRDPSALRAFVVTLAQRIVANEIRRRRRLAHFLSQVDTQQLSLAELADPLARHAYWRLGGVLARLKERDRRVLLMCSIERRGIDEVAELLGLSPATIRRALTRAREHVVFWSASDPFLREFAMSARPKRQREAQKVAAGRTRRPAPARTQGIWQPTRSGVTSRSSIQKSAACESA